MLKSTVARRELRAEIKGIQIRSMGRYTGFGLACKKRRKNGLWRTCIGFVAYSYAIIQCDAQVCVWRGGSPHKIMYS